MLRGSILFQKRVLLSLEHHVLFLKILFYFCSQNFLLTGPVSRFHNVRAHIFARLSHC